MKRFYSVTRSRATGRDNNPARATHERDESARNHVEATDVEPDSQQSRSREHGARNDTPESADLEAREDL
jgi:hypothetical protein